MENSLAHTIQEIADHLTDADATVATLAHLLGNVQQKYTGSGYHLTPGDPRFKSVWVGIAIRQGREHVTDVEVEVAPAVLLHVSELDGLFGRHTPVPPDPSGKPHRIRYLFEREGKPYKSTIYVTLTTPDGADARAESISIRRD